MIQSYLVTEDDNKRLNSKQEVFKWLVNGLDHSICGKSWNGVSFAPIEVVKVCLDIYNSFKLEMSKGMGFPFPSWNGNPLSMIQI